MSHIMFGVINSDSFEINKSFNIKQYDYIEDDIYFLIGNDIPNLEIILEMLVENNVQIENNCVFMLTSQLQPTNSDDLIFPYSKYENDELFKDRHSFEEKSRNNLQRTFKAIEGLFTIFKIKKMLLFLTEEYDNMFKSIECSIKEAQDDIMKQVLDGYYIDSSIYLINK